jgi:hypothetical protein
MHYGMTKTAQLAVSRGLAADARRLAAPFRASVRPAERRQKHVRSRQPAHARLPDLLGSHRACSGHMGGRLDRVAIATSRMTAMGMVESGTKARRRTNNPPTISTMIGTPMTSSTLASRDAAAGCAGAQRQAGPPMPTSAGRARQPGVCRLPTTFRQSRLWRKIPRFCPNRVSKSSLYGSQGRPKCKASSICWLFPRLG